MNILLEFEKRYKGDPADTMAICKAIADDFGMDAETVADFVYIHRYADDVCLPDDETIDDDDE